MDRHTFEITVNREIQQMLDEILPQHASTGSVSRHLLQQQLQGVIERVQAAARDYYLESLRTVDDVADELGVSVEHMCELARHRHFHYGIGRKFGETWVWTPDEVDVLRPQGE
ncbi:MAG: hypothetical protein IT328_09725 [Caldilineaceae bacterium]|nr:hypothetical protein [Caldilineaceae bacterium]